MSSIVCLQFSNYPDTLWIMHTISFLCLNAYESFVHICVVRFFPCPVINFLHLEVSENKWYMSIWTIGKTHTLQSIHSCWYFLREGITEENLSFRHCPYYPSPCRSCGNFFTFKKVSKSVWAMPKRKLFSFWDSCSLKNKSWVNP